MTRLITQRPRARLDLLEQLVYFGEQSGVTLSERYFAAVDETCGFEKYLVFYLPCQNGIDVVRVLLRPVT